MLAALKAQNATITAYLDRVTNAVFWSLGLVGAFTLLLVGYGWWTNRHGYAQERAALQASLKAHVTEQITDARNQLALVHERSAQQLDERIQSAAESHVAPIRAQLHSVQYDFDQLRFDIYAEEASRAEEANLHVSALRSRSKMLRIGIDNSDPYRIDRALDLISHTLAALQNAPNPAPDASDVSALEALPSQLEPAHSTVVDSIRQKLAALL